MKKLGIIIVIESGDLEQKTKLLIDSIRTFGGGIKGSKIWAVKPRKGKAISNETLSFLEEKKVEFIDIDLNKKWHLYGFANKIYASAYIEENFGDQYETLLFLDSDTVVIKSIDLSFFKTKYLIAVKPVEEEVVSIPVGENISDFWEMIYDNCNVSVEQSWTVHDTVYSKEILAYYNSGVIFSRTKCKLFEKWLASFERLTKDSRAYHRKFMEFYLIEQALLSGTIIKNFLKNQIMELENNYNYPLHCHEEFSPKEYSFDEVSILHYHEEFEKERVEKLPQLPPLIEKWLSRHTPMITYRQNVVKRYISVLQYIFWRYKWKLKLLFIKSNN